MCNPGDDLVLAVVVIAISTLQGKSAIEVSILGEFFSAIGDNLAIIVAKKEVCEKG